MSSSPALEPLTCSACGAAVALPSSDEGVCDSCDATFRLPAAYRRLRDEAEQARRLRREAEALWRRLPRPVPAWAAEAGVWVLVGACVVLTTGALIAWAIYGLFDSVRDMLVLGVFTPIFLLIWGMLEAVTARSYSAYVGKLAALPPAEQGRQPLCRVCGAPLRLEPGALAATCDYCQTDSLVLQLSPKRRRKLEQIRWKVTQQLGDAVAAMEGQRRDRKLVRIITLSVLIPCWLGFWFGLPH